LGEAGLGLSNPHAYPGAMIHPFQTDTFDPGDPDLIKQVCAGRKLHEGFHIGSNAHEVNGVRWIHLHMNYPHPCCYVFETPFCRSLAYPLPESYGECPHLAMNAFEAHWQIERRRLWALEPIPAAPEPPPAPPPACPPVPKPKKAPKGRPVALAGAVPLPGLEPWVGFGREG